MSSSEKSLLKRMTRAAQIPEDLADRAVLVQITGQDSVLVENYRGILEYSSERLALQTKTCRLIIEGKALYISYYNGEEMKISGHIEQIHYC
ncbi:MAG: YabP/YqfC family sporulation protein [Candidatus Limivivens sp.]|nr:YabP/YqfC family sporulation protein [Candidatus Limivivens sp.]